MGLFDFFKKKEERPASASPARADLLEKVEVVPGVMLPKALAAHWNEIEKTKLAYIAIKATPGAPRDVRESTFGYYPCLPKDFTYPTDAKGAFMYPFAHINCKAKNVTFYLMTRKSSLFCHHSFLQMQLLII
jgi:hypothetical protein